MNTSCEHTIQRNILNYLEKLMFDGSCVVARVNSGTLALARGEYAKGAIEGYPDIAVLYQGKFYGIEVKSKTGKQSPAQKRMENWIIGCGGIYIIARSLRDVASIIK
jgi:hypothetical protein